MTDVDISLIIPCYNEEKNIEGLLKNICKNEFLKKFEIIVVNDGSQDNTASILKNFTEVIVLTHPTNFGYGQALITGMKSAKRSNIIWMDGDGQHQVEDVVKLANNLLPEDVDFVIGERGKSSLQSTSRILGKYFLRLIIKFSGVKSIYDFNSGLRGFKTKVIKKYWHLLKGGFGASTTTTLILEGRGYFGKSIEITALERNGQSSLNQVSDGLRTLLLIIRSMLLFRPLKFFLSISFVFLFGGLFYGLIVTFQEGTGFPVFGAMLFITGVLTLLLGLVSDQISQMRLEKFE